MRNLKRALSLVLATVMVIGMMVVGASAVSYNDFTDKGEIENAEAVALLNDLKIIEGIGDGSYAPTATIDRAGMAKLITKIMMGDTDPAIFAGTETDLTDIEGHWAEGYIKYCYANGIIAGYNGKFDPNGTIDVAGAAKLLLVALGYDAENRGYVNNGNWSVNIMRDAATTRDATSTKTRSLTAGLTCKATDPLTRDAAAQMIFNALFVNTYEPTYQWDMGTQHINGYNYTPSLAKTMYDDPVRETGTVTGINTDGTAVITGKTANGKLAATSDMLGKTVAWYVTGTPAKLFSTALTVASSDVLATVTSGIANMKNAVTKGHKDFVVELNSDETTPANYDVDIFLNGTAATGTNLAKASFSAGTAGTAAAKVGSIVEFIDSNNDGKADIITVVEKTLDEVTGAVTTKTAANGDVTVRIPGVGNFASDAVSGWEDLAEDDVVLKVTIGGVTYIEVCDFFTGSISAEKGGKVQIDGTYYAFATLPSVASPMTYTPGKALTAWTDGNGNIVKIVMDTAAATDYGVIVKTAWVTNQGVDAAASELEAKLLKADGTTETVIVTKLGGDKVVNGTAGTNEVQIADTNAASGTKLDNTVYKYTLKDGKAELTAITGSNYVAYASGVVSKGIPAVGGKTANNNTVYVYATKSGDNTVYTVYTGFRNAPTTTNTNIAVAVKNGAVEFVYVDATGSTATAGDAKDGNYLYVLDTTVVTRYVGDDVYYDITGALNGDLENTTITTTSNTVANLFSAGNAVVGLFEVTLDDDGYVTAAVKQVGASGTTDYKYYRVLSAAENGVVSLSSDGSPYTFTYTDESVVYVVDGDTITEGTMSDVQYNDDYKDFIYIKAAGSSAPDSTTIGTVYVVKTEVPAV